MNKINFINGQAPALNANNLNLIQTNVENAIDDAIDDATGTASADATSKVNAMASTLRGEIATAQSNAIGTSKNYSDSNLATAKSYADAVGTNARNGAYSDTQWYVSSYKIQYGTSLPSSADNGVVFLLY